MKCGAGVGVQEPRRLEMLVLVLSLLVKYGTKEEDGGRRGGWYCKEYASLSTREIKMPRHADGGHAGAENQREKGKGRHRGIVGYSEYNTVSYIHYALALY